MLNSYAKRGKIKLGMQLFAKYCKFSYNSTRLGRSLSCHKRSAGYVFFQIMNFYQENAPYLTQVSVCTGKSSGARYMKMREEIMYFIDQNCPEWFVTSGCNEGVINVHFRELRVSEFLALKQSQLKKQKRRRNRKRKQRYRKQEENIRF